MWAARETQSPSLVRLVSHLSVSDKCEANLTRPGDWISLAAHKSKPHPAVYSPEEGGAGGEGKGPPT